MIADCWNKNHYVIDPHTACGYYVMQQMPRDPLTPRVLLSTASPYKFPRVVNESLGLDASGTDFECMDVLAKATGTTAPAALRGLETADVRFDNVSKSTAWKDSSSRPRRRCKVSTGKTATIHRRIGCPRYAGGRFFIDAGTVRSRKAGES